MDTETKQTTDTAQSDERFQGVIDELEKIKKEVVSAKNWFERNSSRPRILFRLVGSVTIILSVLVPFLITLDGLWKTLILPIATLTIAGLTSINTFFQWQNQWQGNRQTQYALEHLLLKWEIEIVKAKFHMDSEEAMEMAIESTSKLLDQARDITSSTTGDYFKGVQLPNAK